ncbi:cytochrome c oxidase subunit 7A2, mitochondrial-like [Aethina tumida]|uniref:cytochrome c oxidase subunit 7A2, mitochondrial-like n=1 Tax=Aethina tumida TaxID=116153 RepID=UPI00214960DA|nr:cytochrome c oxidase subunit 7A2, mitochondrial-like [Aethina tumida]
MNKTQELLRTCRMVSRQMSSLTPTSGRYVKMTQTQKHLGVDNNVPVYLKSGLGDKALFGTTVLLTVAGVGLCLDVFYTLTFGKRG